MKAFLIGSLVVIFLIIGGAVTFMIVDSANTIDAQVVTRTVKDTAENIPAVSNAVVPESAPAINTKTQTSARDTLAEIKANGDIPDETDSSKTGFTLGYQASQSTCNDLIELKQDAVDEAQEDYNDAKKAYEHSLDDAKDLTDPEDIDEAQEEIKEKRDDLEDAEDALFSAKEELIVARTTCVV
ncbi:hypothetical protein GF358_01605 [Candidatus Woesearchaeota archaeon]|nr:hypothetical protein [Candidatus Woesearchaeota archaeon]